MIICFASDSLFFVYLFVFPLNSSAKPSNFIYRKYQTNETKEITFQKLKHFNFFLVVICPHFPEDIMESISRCLLHTIEVMAGITRIICRFLFIPFVRLLTDSVYLRLVVLWSHVQCVVDTMHTENMTDQWTMPMHRHKHVVVLLANTNICNRTTEHQ